jgi:metallo-beta-lactamase family protein
VLVPSFSVGRTQLLLEAIMRLQRSGEIKTVPVYLNSPMSIRVNSVFCKHSGETKLTSQEVQDICETAIPIVDVEASRDLNSRREPAIIVAANGMATGGRVLHHLRGLVGSSKHTILFTGYQAEGTRGARMLAGEPTIRIHGEDLPVKAEVAILDNVSAHADGSELMDWLKSGAAPPKSVFITHGEPDASAGLRIRIEQELGWKVEDSPQ